MERLERMAGLRAGGKGKVVTAAEALALVQDGDTVASSGFVGIGFAENLAVALEQRFMAEGSPRGLTLVYAAGQGDGKSAASTTWAMRAWWRVSSAATGAWCRAAEAGGGQPHRSLEPAAGRDLAPLSRHRRRQARAPEPRRPGHLRRPAPWRRAHQPAHHHRAGALMEIDGEEYLFYKAFPIHVGLIRGTTADADGNITMEREALTLESLAIAMAVRNSGGIVIAQVERLAEVHSLNPRQVKIPGILVDCVVVAEKPEYHQQTFLEPYNPAFSARCACPRPTCSRWP
jgi:propionate CoA-transferase